MMKGKRLRRLFGAFTALVLAAGGIAVEASPAAAAYNAPFEILGVNGVVTFTSSHSYTITALIPNPYWGIGVSFYARGVYFEGNARITCESSEAPPNYEHGTTTTFFDSLNCPYANIQQVEIYEWHTDGWSSWWVYLDNPYA